MKKSAVTVSIALFLAVFISVPCAFAGHEYQSPKLKQTTYLMQKAPADGPWEIVLPKNEDGDTSASYGKLKYYNYSYHDMGFCFDFKGYGIEEAIEYALVYYVDPVDGVWGEPWPNVYVLGIAEAKGIGKKKYHENFKLKGCCGIESIPVSDDTNYPNGGKLWLIPTEYLIGVDGNGDSSLDVQLEACTWARMGGWPADVSEILFETSLITYGFVNSPVEVAP